MIRSELEPIRSLGSQILAGLCAALLFSGHAIASEPSWRSKTIEDINAAYALIDQHSPAGFDTLNLEMQAWHKNGRAGALVRAEQVTDENGWRWTLEAYVNGYQDPHLSFSAKSKPPASRYANFIVTQAGDKAVVTWTDPSATSAPALGSVLTSCDGLSLEELKAQKVFSHSLNPRIKADQRVAVRDLFVDRGVFFASAVKACAFDGKVEQPVAWRVAPPSEDPFWQAWRLAGLGASAEAKIERPEAGVFWVGLPSFAPIGEASKTLDAAIAELRKSGDAIRNGRAIVVDLRGNRGGTSLQGDKLADAIWGPDFVKANSPAAQNTAVDWRVSDSNADYLRAGSLLLRLRFPKQSFGKHLASVVVPGIKKAKADGQAFFRDGPVDTQTGGGETLKRQRGDKPFAARVIVLSNGTCASACLDFADIALNMPGTLLVGATAGADGLLMEVRSMDLSSERGSLSIPIKVTRGRGRGNLEAYEPDIAYDGPWSEAAVKAWVLSLLRDGKL